MLKAEWIALLIPFHCIPLLTFLCIYLKVRGREGEREISSTHCFSPYVATVARSRPGQSEGPVVSEGLLCGCRFPETLAIFCGFCRPLAGIWNRSGNSLFTNPCPYKMPAFTGGGFTCYATTLLLDYQPWPWACHHFGGEKQDKKKRAKETEFFLKSRLSPFSPSQG